MEKIVKMVILILVSVLYSCQKDDYQEPIDQTILVRATFNGNPLENASLICVLTNNRDTLIKCNRYGEAKICINTKQLIAVAPYRSSELIYAPFGEQLELPLRNISQGCKSITSTGTFGVYDTDSNGDVRFRYQGTFQYYYCINYLPSIPPNSSNPNNWDGWNLTDFLPWNGKKLLVPRTYQWYHSAVYGYSISDALILVSQI